MKSEFDMIDLGILHYFLGFEFMHTQKGIFLHQRKYTGEVLKRFNMENCNTASVPVMPNLKLTKELDEKPGMIKTDHALKLILIQTGAVIRYIKE
ncbi:hypothetical protein CR513_42055, partial [Mucuna pruriens]